MSLAGSTLAVLSVVANGTPEQVGEWCPQMFGGPGDVKLGAGLSMGQKFRKHGSRASHTAEVVLSDVR
jgi:hypothetical protein